MEVVKNKRRLIDCQYFRKQDVAIIHEILNGHRNYIIIKNPDFEYFIEPELKEHKKETSYFKPRSQLKSIKCKYKDVQRSILQNVPLYDSNNNRILDPNMIDFKIRKKSIMANHNLYSADDNIENRLIMKYYEDYKDEIDESQPIKFLFFDIEVHSDFRYKIYVEIKKIYDYINNKTNEYQPNLDDIDLSYFKPLIECEDLDRVTVLLKNYYKSCMKNHYIDPRLFIALANSKMMEQHKDRCIASIKHYVNKTYMTYFYENLGFPDETKGSNRIDAISFFDSIDKKLYLYLLNVPEDVNNSEDKAYIKDTIEVKDDLKLFIETFLLVSYLKNIEDNEKEIVKQSLSLLPQLEELYKKTNLSKEESSLLKQLLIQCKNEIPNYSDIVKVNIEYELFNSELEMLKLFLTKIKTEIKPNIMAAHNARFDINTITNRLAKYVKKHGDPTLHLTYQLNQLIPYGKEYARLESIIKIDNTPMSKHQEKTMYMFPGVVMLDTIIVYAKLIAKERDFSLNAIAKDILNDQKVEYDFDITEFYMRDIKRFIKYSAVDTLLLHRLEEQLRFIELYQFIMNDTKSGWSSYIYTTSFLTNLLKYEFWYNKGESYVMRNNLTALNRRDNKDNKKSEYDGAYNTDLLKVNSYGLHENLFDLDYSSFYPSCAITTNICPTQFVFSVKDDDKKLHNDYMFMKKTSFAHKYFNMPSTVDILKDL